MSDDLPEGWAARTMGDVASIVGGGTPPANDPANFAKAGGQPWLTPADLSGFRGLYVSRGARNLSAAGLAASSAKPVPSGTVLMSSRAPIGYLAIAKNEISTNQGFKNFVCSKALLPEYVLFWLRSIDDELQEMGSGSTFAEISGGKAKEIPIRVAPLAEQKRIVAKVEALVADVSAASERLAKVLPLLKKLRKSVLADACSGKLTEVWREGRATGDARSALALLATKNVDRKIRRGVPEQVEPPDALASFEPPACWVTVSVAECLRGGALIDVKDGNHGANHPTVADFTDQGLPFITAAQVGRFTIDYDGAYKVEGKPLARLRVGFAEPGDAILTHKGSVGRSAVCKRNCVLTPQTTYYRVDPDVIDADYLVYWFASPWFYSQLAAVMSQTTRDFVPISEQYRMFLAVPPLAEQKEIVRQLKAVLDLAEAIENRAAHASSMARRLPQSILAKAFSGDIVQTEAELARAEGRDYEPASVLLERLASSRSSASKESKQRVRTTANPRGGRS